MKSSSNRRSFIKKSLALPLIAGTASSLAMANLVKAGDGGGGGGSTSTSTSTIPYQDTCDAPSNYVNDPNTANQFICRLTNGSQVKCKKVDNPPGEAG